MGRDDDSRAGGEIRTGPRFGRRDAVRLAALAPLTGFVGGGCDDAGSLDARPAGLAMGPFPCMPASTSMAVWIEGDLGAFPTATAIGEDGDETEASFVPLDATSALARFEGLLPASEYRVALGRRTLGRFRTMPDENGVVRLAFGSDIHPDSKPYAAFDPIRRASPHLYVGLGDQVYADLTREGAVLPTRDAHDLLYRTTWDSAPLVRALCEVPSVFVWDDHEVWNDYDGTGHEAARIDAATWAYDHFQRARSPGPERWSVIDAGPASVFVLDTRSFRSPNSAPDGPGKTMLGAAQKSALLDWLANAPASFRIVASPTALHDYADTGADTFATGFRTERDQLLAAFAAHDPASLAIVSGDLHWPSVVAHTLPGGASLIEYGCTPTAAFPRIPPTNAGPDVLFLAGNVRGFGLITIDGSEGSFEFRFVDEAGATRYRRSM